MKEKKEFRQCNVPGAIIMVVFMVLAVMVGVSVLKIDLIIAMLASIFVAIAVLMIQGAKWNLFEDSIAEAGRIATSPSLILLVVGCLIAAWMACGTIPSIISWGLHLINPKFFLVTAFLMCAVVSTMIGSSVSTVATIGIALVGMGEVMGINIAMTGGAIVSGAYFGDKMSPMSDTTNLAPAVSEANIFEHIKSMMYTTIPAAVICIVIFTILGFGHGNGESTSAEIEEMLALLDEHFNISIICVIPPILILVLNFMKVPALLALLINILISSVIACMIQGETFMSMMGFLYNGPVVDYGNEAVNRLLQRGGATYMFWVVVVGILSVAFGVILEKAGVFKSFIEKISFATKTEGRLQCTTVLSCILVNVLTGEQYMSIVLPGKMYVEEYKKKQLLPQVLSRALEGGGTVVAPLIPWNQGGLNCTRLMGVSTYQYFPFAFLCWMLPVIEIICGFTGKFMWHTGDIYSSRTYEKEK